jgi:hypothetical protein
VHQGTSKPAKESETINEMTNEEICQAVQKVRELAEVNGGNDDALMRMTMPPLRKFCATVRF